MLSIDEVRRFYNRFGRWQDLQVVYEGRALRELARHGRFEQARSVVEFGCGTGGFARQLLMDRLPADARYLGVDVSETMVRLASKRLSRWRDRSTVQLTDGSLELPVEAASCDRVVVNYVFDLLSEAAISQLLAEAGRVLRPGGLLGVANITPGITAASRLASCLWTQVHSRWPSATGGCRPIHTRGYVAEPRWRIAHEAVVTQGFICSEIIVASLSG